VTLTLQNRVVNQQELDNSAVITLCCCFALQCDLERDHVTLLPQLYFKYL